MLMSTINGENKSLRVFISSTFNDLENEREAVRKIISKLGAKDIAMENLGACDERPKDRCLRLIREESNVFVGIYAYRYGNILPGENKSITELEYDEATKCGIKRHIYILDENADWLPKLVDTGREAALLESFKKKLKQELWIQKFSNKDQLASCVATDIVNEFPQYIYRHVGSDGIKGNNPNSSDQWNETRGNVYKENRNVFLAHKLIVSDRPKQKYDIAIYLMPHRSNDPKFLRVDLSDVAKAEFFMGEHFSNKVFTSKNKGGTIGIVVSAYGSFLCTCRVTFSDRTQVIMNRYIDFEMGARIKNLEFQWNEG
jgi:hypothetical protein